MSQKCHHLNGLVHVTCGIRDVRSNIVGILKLSTKDHDTLDAKDKIYFGRNTITKYTLTSSYFGNLFHLNNKSYLGTFILCLLIRHFLPYYKLTIVVIC